MATVEKQNPVLRETTCGSLLQKLQQIWDEVGESDKERDQMLLQLEQECLNVYKRTVDQAAKSRAQLLQELADAKIELCNLLSALGEKSGVGIPEKSSGTIKDQLAAIAPALEHLLNQREERIKEFLDVQSQIEKICGEILGTSENMGSPTVDESDLSLKKLEGFQSQLEDLQKEKRDRLHKVLEFVSNIHDLCAVLGMDFLSTITEVHPTLNDSMESKSISNITLSRLAKTVLALKGDKKQRLQKLHDLTMHLVDLWNLMETPQEDQILFDHVTCNMSALVDEVTAPGALALDLIEQVEVEVKRLDQLKASKMKEISFKKQVELNEIYSGAHILFYADAAQEKILELIEAGNIEPSDLFTDLDNQIIKAKEEALGRKEILDKVEKWSSACEEESWLENYSRDDNRYSASRGAHLSLKRAEKARVLVSKIPSVVESLVTKTKAWEEDHNMEFTYDGVPLLAMLTEYSRLRHEKEDDKRRLRDQKKFQEQKNSEQESIFGSKNNKKVVGQRINGAAAAAVANGTPRRLSTLNSNSSKSVNRDGSRQSARPLAPVNYVSLSKEDASGSHVSGIATAPILYSP